MRSANTMWLCKSSLLLLAFAVFPIPQVLRAQAPPPPPPPPPPPTVYKGMYTPDILPYAGTLDEVFPEPDIRFTDFHPYMGASPQVVKDGKVRQVSLHVVVTDTAFGYVPNRCWIYGTDGRLKAEAETGADGADSLLTRWSYDAAGHVTGYTRLNYSRRKGTWSCYGDSLVYKYDYAGRPVEMARYSLRQPAKTIVADLVFKTNFLYDKNGLVTRNGNGSETFSYQYDDQKRLVKRTIIGSDGRKVGFDTLVYEQQDTMLVIRHYLNGLSPAQKNILVDVLKRGMRSGLDIEYEYSLDRGSNVPRSCNPGVLIQYQYNAQGTRVATVRIRVKDNRLLSRTEYLYNEKGLLAGDNVLFSMPEFDAKGEYLAYMLVKQELAIPHDGVTWSGGTVTLIAESRDVKSCEVLRSNKITMFNCSVSCRFY